MIPAWFLPDGMTDIVFLVLVATSFAASLITVAFGIGGGGVLLAVMAILVPPAALIPTHGVIQIGSNLGRALITFGGIFWPAIPAFAAGSVIARSRRVQTLQSFPLATRAGIEAAGVSHAREEPE